MAVEDVAELKSVIVPWLELLEEGISVLEIADDGSAIVGSRAMPELLGGSTELLDNDAEGSAIVGSCSEDVEDISRRLEIVSEAVETELRPTDSDDELDKLVGSATTEAELDSIDVADEDGIPVEESSVLVSVTVGSETDVDDESERESGASVTNPDMLDERTVDKGTLRDEEISA